MWYTHNLLYMSLKKFEDLLNKHIPEIDTKIIMGKDRKLLQLMWKDDMPTYINKITKTKNIYYRNDEEGRYPIEVESEKLDNRCIDDGQKIVYYRIAAYD